MFRSLVLLLAGLLLVLTSLSFLQATWLPGSGREKTRRTHRPPRGDGLSARLRGPWPRTIIGAGGVLAGLILCFVGAGELFAVLAQSRLQ